jgi:TPR repeat protein
MFKLLKFLLPLLALCPLAITHAEPEQGLAPHYRFSDTGNRFDELNTEANQGDAHAQMTLGLLYFTGLTNADGSIAIPKDIEAGKAWFMRAIDSGSICAMGVLGLEYAEGKNLPRDDAEADSWLKQAVAKGGPEAKIALLERYENGWSIPADDKEVKRLNIETANYGFLDSQVKAADLFLGSQLAPRNLVEAYKWMTLATKAKPVDTNLISKRDDIAVLLSKRQLLVAKTKAKKWLQKGNSECDNTGVTFEFYRLD